MNDTPLGPRRVEDQPTANDETISRLLRAVGPRREVPEDAVTQAREAARAEWQRKVRWNTRRRRTRQVGGWLAMAAVALLALGLVLRFQTGTASGPTLAPQLVTIAGIRKGSVRLAKGSELHLISSSMDEAVLALIKERSQDDL